MRSTPWPLALALSSALACGNSVQNVDPDAGDAASAGDVPPGTDAAPGTDSASADSSDVPAAALTNFSFFVTSLNALVALSGNSQGFGGDLRYGETGAGSGLRGADKICTAIAERSMPGSGAKTWRAFLSVSDGGAGTPVHAIDRVGNGPWYDRLGRLVAMTRADLIATRPVGANALIRDDLPNEDGVPNHAPDPTEGQVDNHDTLTGSNEMGQLYSATGNCLDWTSAVGNASVSGRPRVGHSWPRGGRMGGMGGMGGVNSAHWISALDEAGCAPGVSLIEMGPPQLSNPTVGSGGGYGGFYCFALTP